MTKRIWLDCINSIKRYPRYNEFEELFYFDLDQVLDSMRYSFLVNTMEIDNFIENKIYPYHGVMVILHCDMDLMCSPDFDKRELSDIRPIFHWAQEISHIGNMLNTYPREIRERDYTSPIISLALRKGVITREDIINAPDSTEEKLKIFLPYYKKKVKDNFHRIEKQADKIKSVNLKNFSKNLREVYGEFLKRKHYWE